MEKKKILIVEDEAVIAIDFKSFLEQLGYTVLACVDSAEKALGLAEQEPPDLVLMDIVLKGKMDGIEAADIIRSRWGIPVVFCTAYADQERLERAKLVHPFGYIVKPFLDNDVKVTIEMALYVSEVNREKEKAEEVLQESEKRYRELYDFLPIPVYEMDFEGNITSANRAIYETFGGSEEDFKKGFKAWQLLSPKEIERSSKNIQRLLKGEQLKSAEYTLRRSDGSVFPAIVFASVVYRDDKPMGLRGAIVDFTERKRAEEALRKSEERFRDLAELMPGIVFETDQQGLLTFVNLNAFEHFGYTRKDLAGGLHILDMITPDEHGRAKENMQRSLNGGGVGSNEYLMLRKDGSVFSGLIFSIAIIRDSQSVGLRGFVVDITERKQAEENIKKAEKKYRSIFENAIEGIFQITPDGLFISANTALAHMLGYNAPEDLIRSITDIENQIYEDPDRWAELRRLLESQDKVEGFECPVYRKDGQVIWASINLRAVRNEKGEMFFYEGTGLDITEKKRLQTEIMQADRLSTIGELAAGVAHEINNPINGIINYAQMLIDQTQGPGGENDIPQRIIKEGERIASIVNKLLEFSKDRQENLLPIPIQTPLNAVLDLVGTQMKKDGIRISVKLPPDLPQVLVNSQQIQQVFLNLLSNTRYALNQKYPGDHPGKTLIISVKKIISDQGRPQIRLNFRDAGTGIPKALLDKIFNPFFTTKLADKGTGLGLSISRKIIQDHGGNLWLESREGKYSSAIVELPAAETEKC